MDLSNYKGYLIDKIESEAKVRVSVEKIVLKILPNPRIMLDGFEVKADADTIFSSKTIRMNLYLMPLLKREINIKRVIIDSPLLRVKRDRNGVINISGLFGKNKIKAEIDDVRVTNGRVWFIDEFTGDKIFYTMGNVNLHIKPDYSKGIVYEIKGRLHDDTSESVMIDSAGVIKDYDKEDFLIDGKITANNINLYNYQPYLKSILSETGLNANMNISAGYSLKGWLKSIETNGKIDYSLLRLDMPSIFSKKILSTRGSFDIGIKYDNTAFSANIKNGIFQMPEFTVSAAVWGVKPQGKEFDAGFDAKTSPIPLPVIKGYIPSNILPVYAYQNLSKIDPKNGSMTIDRLVYSSKKPDDFLLKMVFKDAGFSFAGFKKAWTDIEGSLAIRRETLVFENVRGKYGKSSIERLMGNIKDLEKKPVFDLKTAITLDVKDAMDELKQRDFGRTWAKTFGELKEINGFAALTLEASGSLQEKGQLSYNGTAAIKGVNFSHKDLTFPLNDVTGVLNFDNQKIALNNLAGRWEKSNFVCNGIILEYKNNPLLDLSIKGFAAEASLKEVFTELKDSSVHFDNVVSFTSKIKGTEDNMSVALVLDTTKSNVQYSTWFTKPLDYPLFMDGVLNIKRPSDRSLKRLTVEKLNIRFGSASAVVKGDVYKGKASFSFKTNDVDMDDVDNIIPYFKREFKSTGMVSTQLSMVYDLKDGKRDIDGEVKIKDAQFETGVLPKMVSKADIFAKVSGSSVNAVINSFETGRTKLSGKIDIPDIARHDLNFTIAAQYLDADDLYPLQEKRKFIPTGSGSITVKNGRLLNLDIESFRADVLMGKEGITLKPMTFINNQGIVSGGLIYYRDTASGDKPLLTANFKIDGWDAEKILKDIGAKDRIVSGRVNTSFSLTAKRGKENILSGLDGYGNAVSKDGKMWRFVLMSKLFSIVNIISINELLLEGLPYRELKGNFVIKDGVLSTEDLTLDSPSMRMSAVGGINMEQRTVDAKLGVHPFVTVDSIISKIPLAGWIIGGKEKSTLSMYYEVKGPLNNPDVEAVPVKSLGTGILGIFQRILELPADIIKPLVK